MAYAQKFNLNCGKLKMTECGMKQLVSDAREIQKSDTSTNRSDGADDAVLLESTAF